MNIREVISKRKTKPVRSGLIFCACFFLIFACFAFSGCSGWDSIPPTNGKVYSSLATIECLSDGPIIYFVDGSFDHLGENYRSGVVQYDTRTEELLPLTMGDGAVGMLPYGRYIFYPVQEEQGGSIEVYDRLTERSRTMDREAGYCLTLYNDKLYYTVTQSNPEQPDRMTYQIRSANINPPYRVQTIYETQAHAVQRLSVYEDRIYFVDAYLQLWTLPISGGKAEPMLAGKKIYGLGIDEGKMVYASGDSYAQSQLFSRDLDSGEETRLTPEGMAERLHLARDGEVYAYLMGEEGNTFVGAQDYYVYRADGARELVAPQVYKAVCGADGKAYYYAYDPSTPLEYFYCLEDEGPRPINSAAILRESYTALGLDTQEDSGETVYIGCNFFETGSPIVGRFSPPGPEVSYTLELTNISTKEGRITVSAAIDGILQPFSLDGGEEMLQQVVSQSPNETVSYQLRLVPENLIPAKRHELSIYAVLDFENWSTEAKTLLDEQQELHLCFEIQGEGDENAEFPSVQLEAVQAQALWPAEFIDPLRENLKQMSGGNEISKAFFALRKEPMQEQTRVTLTSEEEIIYSRVIYAPAQEKTIQLMALLEGVPLTDGEGRVLQWEIRCPQTEMSAIQIPVLLPEGLEKGNYRLQFGTREIMEDIPTGEYSFGEEECVIEIR